ncbi:DNA starvation/stationary phase protection protein [Candidatus Dependentiae bacterium]|nr:DNA starvation/stationary phase protection protein [Candidatus Dependentiae bacterium]
MKHRKYIGIASALIFIYNIAIAQSEKIIQLNTGLTDKQCSGSAQILNALLANEYVLYTKTLNYHWNIKGVHFGSLHTFFGDQYEILLKIIDSIAERIKALNQHAIGTLQEFSRLSSLTEQVDQLLSEKEMVQDLLNNHEAIIRQLRIDLQRAADEFNDMGTNNFLTDLLEKHEKMAWMLRAHLQ